MQPPVQLLQLKPPGHEKPFVQLAQPVQLLHFWQLLVQIAQLLLHTKQLTQFKRQPWQPVQLLQCPVHTKQLVQLAQLPVQPSLHLLVQLLTQLLQLDAHLE